MTSEAYAAAKYTRELGVACDASRPNECQVIPDIAVWIVVRLFNGSGPAGFVGKAGVPVGLTEISLRKDSSVPRLGVGMTFDAERPQLPGCYCSDYSTDSP